MLKSHLTSESHLLCAAILFTLVSPLLAPPPTPRQQPDQRLISEDVKRFLPHSKCSSILPQTVLDLLLRPLGFKLTENGMKYNATCTRPYPQTEHTSVPDPLGELCTLAFNTVQEACSLGSAAVPADILSRIPSREKTPLEEVCGELSQWVTQITPPGDHSGRLYGDQCKTTCADPVGSGLANGDCYGLYQGRRVVAVLKDATGQHNAGAGGSNVGIPNSQSLHAPGAAQQEGAPAIASSSVGSSTVSSASVTATTTTASASAGEGSTTPAPAVAGRVKAVDGGAETAAGRPEAPAGNPETEGRGAEASAGRGGVGSLGDAAQGTNVGEAKLDRLAASDGAASLAGAGKNDAPGIIPPHESDVQVTITPDNNDPSKITGVGKGASGASATSTVKDASKANAIEGVINGAADTKPAPGVGDYGGANGGNAATLTQGDIRPETDAVKDMALRQGSTSSAPLAARGEMPLPPVAKPSPDPSDIQHLISSGQAALFEQEGVVPGPSDKHSQPDRQPADSDPTTVAHISSAKHPSPGLGSKDGRNSNPVVSGGERVPVNDATHMGGVEKEGDKKKVDGQTHSEQGENQALGEEASVKEGPEKVGKEGVQGLQETKVDEAQGNGETVDAGKTVEETGKTKTKTETEVKTEKEENAKTEAEAKPGEDLTSAAEEEVPTEEGNDTKQSEEGATATATEKLPPVSEDLPAGDTQEVGQGSVQEGQGSAQEGGQAAGQGSAQDAVLEGQGDAQEAGQGSAQEAPPTRPIVSGPSTNDKVSVEDSYETGGDGPPLDDDFSINEPQPVYKDTPQVVPIAQQPIGGSYISGAVPAQTDDSNFFAYFLTAVVLCIVLYLAFHNKQKILALVIEGRSSSNRRRPHSSQYRRLDNSLEEAISSQQRREVASSIVY